MQKTSASQLCNRNVIRNFTAFELIDNQQQRGCAKVNKIKIFSGLYYIIKRKPTLVSGALEPVKVDFIGQNKVKILG